MIEVKLTTHERVLKRNIEELRKNINETVGELGRCVHELCRICEEHGHKIVPRDLDIDEQLTQNRFASTGAYCVVCGKEFGWWCPKSPDYYCQYTGQKCDVCGEVIGEGSEQRMKHVREKKHDASFAALSYNTDRCVFCGMPEERK